MRAERVTRDREAALAPGKKLTFNNKRKGEIKIMAKIGFLIAAAVIFSVDAVRSKSLVSAGLAVLSIGLVV